MTRKKIRYSELAPVSVQPAEVPPAAVLPPAASGPVRPAEIVAADSSPPSAPVAPRAQAPRSTASRARVSLESVVEAPAEPSVEPALAPAPEPSPAPAGGAEPDRVSVGRPTAPLDLARALAAARSAEAAAAAVAVTAPPGASVAPATRVIDAAVIDAAVVAGRLTPVRGSLVMRPQTPLRGSRVIALDAAPPAPAPAPGAAHAAPDAASAAPVHEETISLRERARQRSGTVELLVFAIGGEWFGVELARVEEAVDLSTIRHIPEMPPAMLGVTTVRGSLTPVYAPEAALGLPPAGHSSALVFRRPRGRLGIAVDDVDDVHTLDLAALNDAPGTDASDGILLGVLRYRDALLALVDAESLITACQTVPVLETA